MFARRTAGECPLQLPCESRFPPRGGFRLSLSLADCLTFYRYPQFHWRRLRSANVIERASRAARRRTNVARRFPGEAPALALLRATLEKDRLKWRGVELDESLHARALKARPEVKLGAASHCG